MLYLVGVFEVAGRRSSGSASRDAGAGRGPDRPGLPSGLTTQAAETLADRYRAGATLEALAKEFHLPARTISQALAAQGVPLRVRQPGWLLPRDRLEELYVSRRLPSAEVARRLKVSSQKVRDDLRYHGIPLRPRRPPLDPLPVGAGELRRLYLGEGLSVGAIAAKLDCSRHAVTTAMDRFGIPIRPRVRVRRDEAEASRLRALYFDQGLPVSAVAREMGRSTAYVATRLELYGIPRRAVRPRPVLDRAWLERAWVGERRSLAEVAEAADCAQSWVASELARHGLRRPRRTPRLAGVSHQQLEELYVRKELSVSQVARNLGCSPNWVADNLRRAGIPVRSRHWRRGQPATGVNKDVVEDLYVRQGLSVAEAASRLGLVADSLYPVLRRFGIPLRPARQPLAVSLSSDEMEDLYVQRRLSEEEIATQLGTSAWQVRLRRRALGVRRPSSPPPHPPPVVSPGPEVLEALYIDEGRTLVQIARAYHTSAPKVRSWLEEAGIEVAARTSRADRIDLPVEDLRALYLGLGLSMREVGAELDVSQGQVRRALHDHGIPVRATRARPAPTYRLLDDLYDDPAVAEMLRAHGLPEVRRPGPIAERFPVPAQLTPSLLEEAYLAIGLSARHIEMLTGQPMEQVLDALRAVGIPVRMNTGLSPWRRNFLFG